MKKLLCISLLLFSSTLGCGSNKVTPSESPLGMPFPQVRATTLANEPITLPDDLKGKPAVLLVAYVQKAQFDVDRWLLPLLENEVDVAVYEVPTMSGMIPSFLSATIDNGMRGGIPQQDWASVVTVFDGADKIEAVIGNNGSKNAHVVLLDRNGQIVWQHSEGYSARVFLRLQEELEALGNA